CVVPPGMAERICGGTPVQVTVSAICHAPVFTSRGCRLADIALPTTAPREATARILLLIFLSPFTMSVTESPLWPNHGPKTGARQHQGAECDRGGAPSSSSQCSRSAPVRRCSCQFRGCTVSGRIGQSNCAHEGRELRMIEPPVRVDP